MHTNRTNVGTQHQIEELRNLIGATSNNGTPPLWTSDVREPQIREVSSGPEVHFEVEEHNFQSLVPKLVEFERIHGYSSIEMFSQYLSGSLALDEGVEEWVDMFILFLGTREIRRFACP
jgi:hypothetical protein